MDLASTDGPDRLTVREIIESGLSKMTILNEKMKHHQRKKVERALEEAIGRTIKPDMKSMSKKQIVETSLRLFMLQKALGNSFDRDAELQ